MSNCSLCGSFQGEDHRFVLVQRDTEQRPGPGGKPETLVRETCQGVISAAVCPACIARKKRKSALWVTGATLVVTPIVTVAALLTSRVGTSNPRQEIASLPIVLPLAGALILVIGLYTVLSPKKAQVAADLVRPRQKLPANVLLLPLDRTLYADRRTGSPTAALVRKRAALETDLAEALASRMAVDSPDEAYEALKDQPFERVK